MVHKNMYFFYLIGVLSHTQEYFISTTVASDVPGTVWAETR